MKKRPKLEGCNNLQIGVKSILQKINPIKRINEKKKMDNGQPQDINKRQFIKKGLFGVGIGALAALLSKIPFARAVQNINYDNSANAMAVSSDGIVNLPNQSGCLVYLSSHTSVDSGTPFKKLEFDSESYDIQNEFDSTTNNRFTATKAGKYMVLAQTGVGGGIGPANYSDGFIYKNGGVVVESSTRSHEDGQSLFGQLAITLDLDASDYVEIFVYHTHSPSRNFLATTRYNHMSVNKIA